MVIVTSTFSVETDSIARAIARTRTVLAIGATRARSAYHFAAILAHAAFHTDASAVHAESLARAFVGAFFHLLIQGNAATVWKREAIFANTLSR